MAMIGKLSTLTIAELVLKHMEWIAGDDPTHHIIVTGFRAGKVSGLHFANQSSGRSCNIVGHHVGIDSIVFNYGESTDYDYDTGHAKDTVTKEVFDVAQIQDLAWAAMNWLTGNERTYRGDL